MYRQVFGQGALRRNTGSSTRSARRGSIFYRLGITTDWASLRRSRYAQLGLPRFGAFDGVVDGIDILDAFFRKPVLQRLHALLRVDRDAFLPRRAAAEDAGIIGAGFGGHVQRFGELRVADSGAQVDEGFGSDGGGFTEIVQCLGARIRLLAFVDGAAFNEFGVDRHFDFQDVDEILGLGKFRHASGDDFGLALGVCQTLFIAAGGIVSHEFQEERNIVRHTLGADAFDERVFDIVHLWVVEGRVVNQNLDCVGAPVDDALHGYMRQQIGQSAGLGVVVAAGFV